MGGDIGEIKLGSERELYNQQVVQRKIRTHLDLVVV